MTERVYLSRRNLLTLLNKLDARKRGEQTECQIIKQDTQHPRYPQTIDALEVIAVEDEDYYTERFPGVVRQRDNPNPGDPQSIDMQALLDAINLGNEPPH